MKRLLFFVSLFFLSCGTVAFNYDHYTLDGLESFKGMLYAEDEDDDINASVCQPEDGDRGKCIVFLRAEYHRLRDDLDKQRLENLLDWAISEQLVGTGADRGIEWLEPVRGVETLTYGLLNG